MRETLAASSWADVRAALEALGPRREVWLARSAICHPREAGALASFGLPKGQTRDWRFPAGRDGTGLHVHEHTNGWAAHIDRVHPALGLIAHLQADAPGVLLAGGAAVGASLGALVRAPFRGALAGTLLALAFVAGGRRG